MNGFWKTQSARRILKKSKTQVWTDWVSLWRAVARNPPHRAPGPEPCLLPTLAPAVKPAVREVWSWLPFFPWSAVCFLLPWVRTSPARGSATCTSTRGSTPLTFLAHHSKVRAWKLFLGPKMVLLLQPITHLVPRYLLSRLYPTYLPYLTKNGDYGN